MRKLIAAINMTLDGFCDHTAIAPDEEIHQHYNDLLSSAGVTLYGRITYGLMEYWRTIAKNPTGIKSTDDFAVTLDNIPKIVFSRTLKTVDWETATLAKRDLKEEVLELKQQSGKDILVGSRSLIVQLLNSNLIDEFQICIHPVIEGKGLPLFDQIKGRTVFKRIKTKSLQSGVTVFYYEPASEKTTNR